MNLALLFTILQGASALQLRPRTRTQSTALFSYLDQISGGEAASKLAKADAAYERDARSHDDERARAAGSSHAAMISIMDHGAKGDGVGFDRPAAFEPGSDFVYLS